MNPILHAGTPTQRGRRTYRSELANDNAPVHQAEPQYMGRPCGFCAQTPGRANPAPHAGCPGVVTNGNGIVLHCPCRCRAIHCRSCGNEQTGDVDPIRWRCIDTATCAVRVADKREAVRVSLLGPNYKPKDAKMTNPIQDALAGSRREAAGTTTRRSARPKVGVCECGCAGATKGGKFQPGHDARLKSSLSSTLKQEFDKAKRVLALAELFARAWATNKQLIDIPVEIQDEARALIERVGGNDELARKATLARNQANGVVTDAPDA